MLVVFSNVLASLQGYINKIWAKKQCHDWIETIALGNVIDKIFGQPTLNNSDQ